MAFNEQLNYSPSICHSPLFSVSVCVYLCSVHIGMIFTCMWMHVWEGVQAHVYMWTWRTKGDAGNHLPWLSRLILWAKISPRSHLELADKARFSNQLVGRISYFSVLRQDSQTSCHALHHIYRGSGDWNSFSHVCMACNLTMESTS